MGATLSGHLKPASPTRRYDRVWFGVHMPPVPKAPSPGQPGDVLLRRYFVRNGVVYDAWDYGHKAWPIRRKKR